KITRALEHMFGFLKFVNINPSTFAFMVGLSIRFIPVFFKKMDNVIKILKIRGIMFNKGSLKERLNKYALILQLLCKSIDTYAENLSISMRLRGFNTDKKRTSCYKFSFTWRDYAVMSILPIFLII
ncbi:energy-coupling factor transporter transmembrane component T family protein, partial [bacterium]